MSEQTERPWYTYHTFDPRRILIVRMNGEPGGTPLEWQRKVIYPPVAVVIGDNMADANLIAAAPEMYEVLETIAPYLWSHDEFSAHKSIMEILAKARGES